MNERDADSGQFWNDPVAKRKKSKFRRLKKTLLKKGLEEKAISLLHSSKEMGPHRINSIL